MACMGAVTDDHLLVDVDAALAHLDSAGHPAEKVGIVGFCMGGQLSLYAATKNPAIGACVIYYGIHPNVQPDIPALQAPVLGFFGERDPMVTPDAVAALQESLESAGKSVEFHSYAADHAFFNDTRSDVYSATAATDSWTRMLGFYRQHLG